jgi:hypothetical protein
VHWPTVVIAVLCAGCATPIAGQGDPVPDRRPEQVKPPRQPVDTHPRLALGLGVTVLPWVRYDYQTAVTLNGGRQLAYSGAGAAPGLMVFASPAIVLPGSLRRVSVGADLSAGGLYTLSNAVIPAGTAAPFSTSNLQQAIKAEHSFGQGWHPLVSPYIEHDIASIRDNKLRLGYQFLTQSGEYAGAFPPNPVGLASAGYDVRMTYRAHLIRFSWTNYLYAGDYGRGGGPPEHRTGLLRRIGVCAGTHRTIEIFFAIGPIWDL